SAPGFAMQYCNNSEIVIFYSPMSVATMRREPPCIRCSPSQMPSQHLNKAHWSTVYLDGSLPDSQIYYLVDASYQQAVKMLPEPVRQQLTR
ncbi:MmcQ/YjbR family DNA-binding protein, partial [Klebsiella pneumoniae]|uniref:MmcQ/YjbR family DNA-binding protein n=1 Tax=Klebsiella pneumoniae TaxID=573 RepID=UPI003EDF54C0